MQASSLTPQKSWVSFRNVKRRPRSGNPWRWWRLAPGRVVAYRNPRAVVRGALKGFKDLGERSQGNAAEKHGGGV